tara:strand:+ start:232 stop:492 length:261 start_codon:yes stop_codon:yes gene_type:complete
MKKLGQYDDPIMRDIKQAVREGYFDEDRSDNELRITPVAQLLEDTAMMSRQERKRYLAKLGNIRTGQRTLTNKPSQNRKKTKWLSR